MLRSVFASICGLLRQTMVSLLPYTFVPHGKSCDGWHKVLVHCTWFQRVFSFTKIRYNCREPDEIKGITSPHGKSCAGWHKVFVLHDVPLRSNVSFTALSCQHPRCVWAHAGVSWPLPSLRHGSLLCHTLSLSPSKAFAECDFVPPGICTRMFTSGGCLGLWEAHTAETITPKFSLTVLQGHIDDVRVYILETPWIWFFCSASVNSTVQSRYILLSV